MRKSASVRLTLPNLSAFRYCENCLDKHANKHYEKVMIVYDGIYRLPTGADQGFKPRAQWEYAWQVRIIDLGLSQSAVLHLKSIIVVVNQTGIKACLTSGAESIGKKISRDFNLVIPRVLWVEHFPDNLDQWCAAAFKLKSNFGPDINYYIRWRPLRPNEVDLIKPFVPEVDKIN